MLLAHREGAAGGDDSASSAQGTAAHELTHFLREKSPARYAELKDFVVKNLVEKGRMKNGVNLMELLRDKRDLYAQHGQALTMDAVMEEVVADACEMVLGDKKLLARMETDNAKLSGSFRDYMRAFLTKIKKAFTGAEATHAEAKAMQGVIRDLEKIWSAGVFGEGEAATQANKNAAQESGGKYAIKHPEYTDDQMRENSVKLQIMQPVKVLTGNEFSNNGKNLSENVLAYFNSLGNNVYSEEFGDVALTKSSVRSEIRHGITKNKISAFAALPEVIQNGTVIYTIDKGQNVERIITAAPIRIGKDKYYMAVMLQRDPSTQRLYTHDVVIAEESTSLAGSILTTDKADSKGDKLFMTDILQNALSVKRESVNSEKKL